jgi:hypothetical protein
MLLRRLGCCRVATWPCRADACLIALVHLPSLGWWFMVLPGLSLWLILLPVNLQAHVTSCGLVAHVTVLDLASWLMVLLSLDLWLM